MEVAGFNCMGLEKKQTTLDSSECDATCHPTANGQKAEEVLAMVR